jgi:hypothetical protein
MKAALHSTNFAAGKKYFIFQRYKNEQSKYGMVSNCWYGLKNASKTVVLIVILHFSVNAVRKIQMLTIMCK